MAHREKRCQVLPSAVFPCNLPLVFVCCSWGGQPCWGQRNIMRQRLLNTIFIFCISCTVPSSLTLAVQRHVGQAHILSTTLFDVGLMPNIICKGGEGPSETTTAPLHLLCCAYLAILKCKGCLFEGGTQYVAG